MNAVIDGIDDNNIWEFKCVKELSIEHYLQLIIYAWIWRHTKQETLGKRKFFIMNIFICQYFFCVIGYIPFISYTITKV